MSGLLAVRGVVPPHTHAQAEITEVVAGMIGDAPLLRRLHEAAGVRRRHLSLPLPELAALPGFTEANEAFADVGLVLAERAVSEALDAAGLAPGDVDLVVSTTVTGLAVPGIDARLVTRLGLRPDVRRVPIFGLGCVAGAAGLARVHDWLLGRPRGVAVLLSVELCSLTVQRDDDSVANQVGSGLFGDGAAAVVLVGAEHPAAGRARARIVDSRSSFYPDTERVMGWEIGAHGFRIVLAPTVPDVVEKYLRDDVDGFLGDHGLGVGDLGGPGAVVAHPGGPKVIAAIERTLGLGSDALAVTRDCLADVGNLSSASVLHVLERTLAGEHPGGPPEPGTPGLLFAMGPGFCSEQVLLTWGDAA
jgi:alkylresorcinol/alkylpyrone synthase